MVNVLPTSGEGYGSIVLMLALAAMSLGSLSTKVGAQEAGLLPVSSTLGSVEI